MTLLKQLAEQVADSAFTATETAYFDDNRFSAMLRHVRTEEMPNLEAAIIQACRKRLK